jgi:hypothetical protein
LTVSGERYRKALLGSPDIAGIHQLAAKLRELRLGRRQQSAPEERHQDTAKKPLTLRPPSI